MTAKEENLYLNFVNGNLSAFKAGVKKLSKKELTLFLCAVKDEAGEGPFNGAVSFLIRNIE